LIICWKEKKMTRSARTLLIICAILIPCIAAHAQEQKFADLGDFKLENGQVIKGCRLGYRTYGTLDQKKSNAVIFPTWFAGTTKNLADLGLIGKGKLADPSRYFIVAVDSLGNGVSSSPSNSREQPGTSFPAFTIRDMVESEHAMVTKVLGLPHVFAVIGISMGGFQALEWEVAHPEFMDRAVSIVGSPRPTTYDLALWEAETRAIDAVRGMPDVPRSAMHLVVAIHTLAMHTPAWLADKVPPDKAAEFLADTEKGLLAYDINNWAWQIKAITAQDIFKRFGGSAEKTAAAIRARTLVVVSKDDHCVYQGPAKSFASLLKAELYELQGECGHLNFLCQPEELARAVNAFLGKK
jgi:homoserine O-acetyltransferase